MTKKIRTTQHTGEKQGVPPKPQFGDEPWQTPRYGEEVESPEQPQKEDGHEEIQR